MASGSVGIRAWFRRIFGGAPLAAPAGQPAVRVVAPAARATPRSEPRAAVAAAPVPAHDLPTIDDLGQRETSDAEFALDDDDASVAALIELTRAHFLDHRPDPTSFPSLATRVIDLVEHAEVDVNKLIATIQQDSAISIQVLKVANSAVFRRDQPISELRAAVAHIGTREIAGIAAGVAGRSLFDAETRAEFDLYGAVWTRLFSDAMVTALGATSLAIQRGRRSDVVFLAGLFHDVGKSLALRSLAGLLITGMIPDAPSERSVLRVVEALHVELGLDMLTAWNLPPELLLITGRHHEHHPPATPEMDNVHIVRVVSGLHVLRTSTAPPPGLATEVLASLAALGIDRFELRALRTELEEVEARVRTMFQD